MLRTITVVAAMLIVFSAAAVEAQEAEVTIRGRIVDSVTGDPIAGSATVFMNHDGSLVSDNTTATEDGAFTLVVPTEPRRMLVWAERYAPKELFDFMVEGEYTVDLDALRTLTAQLVREEDGEPIGDVAVRVRYDERGDKYLPDWLTHSLERQLVRTDPDGIFVVRDVVPNAPVLLLADYPGESRVRVPEIQPEHTSAPRQDLRFETQVWTGLVVVAR